MSIATHPMPPSLIAIFRVGCFTGYSDHSHSAAACSESWPKSVAPICNPGEPGGPMTEPELPTCSDTTVSVSTHAWMIGSQWSRSQRLGRPIASGRSGIEMPVKPRSALRWISATAASGSLNMAMPSGTMRVGCARYHSS